MPGRRAAFDLILISALGLFVELVFIRWVASELRIVAFYKNLALIAAFLGLGLGFAVARRPDAQSWFERWYLPFMGACVLAVLILGRTALSEAALLNPLNAQEYIWAGSLTFQSRLAGAILSVAFYAILLTLFLLITVLFIPLGSLTAAKFRVFPPLTGYTLNVLGSLTGSLLYVLVSFLGWPPPIWFLGAGAAAVYFLPRWSRMRWWFNLACAALVVILLWLWPTGADRTLWSPYYRIDLRALFAPRNSQTQLGYDLSVNQAWHQKLLNLDPSFVVAHRAEAPEHFEAMTAQYDAPFKAAPRPERVLVVGAGTGNDVAAALRANAGQITAVEIDPLILSVGRALHPERPYGDGRRVAAVNEDARAFFHNDRAAYDLIVFGLLDSHTLFSAASSIRLDNFVYTRESLAEARARLAQAGLLALSFGVPREQEWVGLRLYCTLAEVFGHPPQVYQFPSGDILFLIGRTPGAAPRVDDPRLLPRADYACPAGMPVPTDDWPYLYLRERALPLNYAVVLIGILLLSAGLVRRALPDFRQVNGHFFFMGAAFFLLETKSVTEMALLLGSTWVVNASVIAAILLMIVGANALVARRRLRRAGPWYALLAVSLLVNFLAPINQLLGLPPIVRVALASLLLALPLFFAGLIFALTFSRARAVEAALGSNLIGSVLGGLLEYASLVLGIRSLYALALGMYGLSAFFLSRARDAA